MKAISQAQRQLEFERFSKLWLRRYFLLVGLVALGFGKWKLLDSRPGNIGSNGFQICIFGIDCAAYLLLEVLLLFPWWRMGAVITGLGYACALPACAYVLVGLSIVDAVYVHRPVWFHLLLVSGLLAQVFWLLISLGAQTAESEKPG